MNPEPQGLRILPDVPRSKRVRILIGESDVLTTSRDVLRVANIHEGTGLTAEAVTSLVREIEPESARQRALRLLAHRERSACEIRRRLVEDGYPEEVSDAVVSRLVDVSFVDDRRFSAALVRAKCAAGWGRSRIARSLKESGVDDDVARDALDAQCPKNAERSRAERLATQMPRADRKERERTVRRLVSRGFSWEEALAAASISGGEDGSHELP